VTAAWIELAAGSASATISPDEGGMLLSVRVAGHELLVPRREGTGPVPTFGSFLVAPWVGELSLGEVAFRGTKGQVPRNLGRHAVHGLVSGVAWEVVTVARTAATLGCSLGSPWPFGGAVVQHLRLDEHGITLEAEIRAAHQAMPAALGWHPWFACPDPGRVRVGVQADSMLELDEELLPTGSVLPVTGDSDLRGAPFLGDRKIDTVFVGATSPATLGLPELDLQLHFDPAIDTIVVYTPTGAVCVEPWSAWPDAIRMSAAHPSWAADPSSAAHPSGLTVLEPGESMRRWTRWAWS
jgi:aldose 1-epimerase